MPTLYQYQLEIEDGYRRDGSPVRIGYDDTRFPDYSWRGYGSYSQLQNEVRTALRQLTHWQFLPRQLVPYATHPVKIDLSPQVLLDVPIEHSSVYRMVIRYTNPNPEPVIGEVSVVRSVGEGDANPQTHQVSFSPAKFSWHFRVDFKMTAVLELLFLFSLLPTFPRLAFQSLFSMQTDFHWLELGSQVDSPTYHFQLFLI